MRSRIAATKTTTPVVTRSTTTSSWPCPRSHRTAPHGELEGPKGLNRAKRPGCSPQVGRLGSGPHMDGLRRLVFQRSPKHRACGHLEQIRVYEPAEPTCGQCVSEGSRWVHVRRCMICGETACCDSSKRRHARRHFETTGHALIRSVEPGESWGWCYLDSAYLTSDEYMAHTG